MDSALPLGSIVVGIDGSDHSHDAVRWATREAGIQKRTLVIATATGRPRQLSTRSWGDSRQRANRVAGRRHVDRAYEVALDEDPAVRVETLVRATSPEELLLDLAGQAHLIVVGSRGLGQIGSLTLGSVSQAVSSASSCPVVIARPASQPTTAVVVGHDGSEASTAAVKYAFDFAAAHQVPLTVVHAVWRGTTPTATDTDDPVDRVAQSVEHLRACHPEVEVRFLGVLDNPVQALLNSVAPTDLVVVGKRANHGRTGAFLGSVSQRIAETAQASVAVVDPTWIPPRTSRSPATAPHM